METNTLLILVFLGAMTLFTLVILLAFFAFNKKANSKQVPSVQNKPALEIVELRLKAYERLVIMLDRLTPSKLVMRINQGAMDGAQLQIQLMKAIRDEFEHNVSMQIYVSTECWTRVCASRDEVLRLVQLAAAQVGPKSSSLELSKEIFALEEKSKNASIQHALNRLRDEAHAIMI